MKYPRRGNYNPFISNPDNIDALSLSLIPEKVYVLELGCGDGRLTEFIKKKLHCRIVTAELIKNNAKNANQIADRVILGDIENKAVRKKILKSGPYYVVYASAVIGSLVYPEILLKDIKKWLKKNGFLVITFANIAHLSQRLKFFSGKFNYEDSGLCSREHLRFYTLASAEKLIRDSGYKIIKKDYDLVGFPRLEKMLYFIPRSFFRRFYNLSPGLFAYQSVFKLIPYEKEN